MTELFNELTAAWEMHVISEEDRVVHSLASLLESAAFSALVTALEANENVPKLKWKL